MNWTNKLLRSGIATWVVILLIWQGISMQSSPDFLPGPWKTLQGAYELSEDGSLFL